MKNVIRVLVILLIISGVVFLKTLSDYTINEVYIGQLNKGIQNNGLEEYLTIINIQESYIPYYNLGNGYYKSHNYAQAVESYEKAVQLAPYENVCNAEANQALAMLGGEAKYTIDYLKNIQDVLLQNGCAATDYNGRDEKSQKIYNALEQALSGDDSDASSQQQSTGESKESEEPSDLREKLQEQRQESNAEMNKAQDMYMYTEEIVIRDKGRNW